MRVEFDDGWVDLVELSDLRDGDRKALNRASKVEVNDEGVALLPGDFADRMMDVLLARVVLNWSLSELPIPSVDASSLEKLPIGFAKNLRESVAGHMKVLRQGGGPGERGSVPTRD